MQLVVEFSQVSTTRQHGRRPPRVEQAGGRCPKTRLLRPDHRFRNRSYHPGSSLPGWRDGNLHADSENLIQHEAQTSNAVSGLTQTRDSAANRFPLSMRACVHTFPPHRHESGRSLVPQPHVGTALRS